MSNSSALRLGSWAKWVNKGVDFLKQAPRPVFYGRGCNTVYLTRRCDEVLDVHVKSRPYRSLAFCMSSAENLSMLCRLLNTPRKVHIQCQTEDKLEQLSPVLISAGAVWRRYFNVRSESAYWVRYARVCDWLTSIRVFLDGCSTDEPSLLARSHLGTSHASCGSMAEVKRAYNVFEFSLEPRSNANFAQNYTKKDNAPDSSALGAAVAERLDCSPPTKASRVQSPAGSPDLRKWESCWTMPLVGGFSRGSPVSPAPSYRRCSIFSSITLIDSQHLAVNSRPNLFTHSLTRTHAARGGPPLPPPLRYATVPKRKIAHPVAGPQHQTLVRKYAKCVVNFYLLATEGHFPVVKASWVVYWSAHWRRLQSVIGQHQGGSRGFSKAYAVNPLLNLAYFRKPCLFLMKKNLKKYNPEGEEVSSDNKTRDPGLQKKATGDLLEKITPRQEMTNDTPQKASNERQHELTRRKLFFGSERDLNRFTCSSAAKVELFDRAVLVSRVLLANSGQRTVCALMATLTIHGREEQKISYKENYTVKTLPLLQDIIIEISDLENHCTELQNDIKRLQEDYKFAQLQFRNCRVYLLTDLRQTGESMPGSRGDPREGSAKVTTHLTHWLARFTAAGKFKAHRRQGSVMTLPPLHHTFFTSQRLQLDPLLKERTQSVYPSRHTFNTFMSQQIFIRQPRQVRSELLISTTAGTPVILVSVFPLTTVLVQANMTYCALRRSLLAGHQPVTYNCVIYTTVRNPFTVTSHFSEALLKFYFHDILLPQMYTTVRNPFTVTSHFSEALLEFYFHDILLPQMYTTVRNPFTVTSHFSEALLKFYFHDILLPQMYTTVRNPFTVTSHFSEALLKFYFHDILLPQMYTTVRNPFTVTSHFSEALLEFYFHDILLPQMYTTVRNPFTVTSHFSEALLKFYFHDILLPQMYTTVRNPFTVTSHFSEALLKFYFHDILLPQMYTTVRNPFTVTSHFSEALLKFYFHDILLPQMYTTVRNPFTVTSHFSEALLKFYFHDILLPQMYTTVRNPFTVTSHFSEALLKFYFHDILLPQMYTTVRNPFTVTSHFSEALLKLCTGSEWVIDYRGAVAAYAARASRTRPQDGVGNYQHVGALMSNQRLVNYSPAGSSTNRQIREYFAD
ncbi:hypothetical protein PR048_010624 [Dryococelus australis]|uniref:Uncharacterized protein n=1 Tax=Dryococelus australis TaxID=614101 RepID=A0ABQ9I589_9NEOP|nr:hypothetical protein PR048_010624 [Dryococelus australis]